MTTLTHRDPGPDKRAAEMSDSDDAGHAIAAGLPAAKAAMHAGPAGARSFADRRRQHAWVPGTAALLTTLIGLSDIVAIFKPDLAAPAAQHQLPGAWDADQRHPHRRRHHRADAADAGARPAPQETARLAGGGRAARLRHRHPFLPRPADTDRDRRAGAAHRAALLPGRVLRRGDRAPGGGRCGSSRPGGGRRRHRAHLHHPGPGAADRLLAGPAGPGGHLRPGRGVRPGSVGAGGAGRPVRHPHQRARGLHPRLSRRTCSCARRSRGPGWAARTRPGSGTCSASTATGTRSGTSRCGTTRA